VYGHIPSGAPTTGSLTGLGIPAHDVSLASVPAETVPFETVPAETVPFETVPAETVPVHVIRLHRE
jgi:hypothetical protein